MKIKLLLPMLAVILAIGMSFTTVNDNLDLNDPNTDYILLGGAFEPIDMELNCGVGNKTCIVQREPGGPEHWVYDGPNSSTLKKGDGNLRTTY